MGRRRGSPPAFNHALTSFLYQISLAGIHGSATHWDPMPHLPPLAPGEQSLPGRRADPGHTRAAGFATAASILTAGASSGRLTYLTRLGGRPGQPATWPAWVPAELTAALAAAGIAAPWQHQAEAAELAASGRSVIISTGTASGKSLGYLLPALTGVLAGGTVLYIAPTRALAADQVKLVRSLKLQRVRAAVVDGDTPWAERTRARSRELSADHA